MQIVTRQHFCNNHTYSYIFFFIISSFCGVVSLFFIAYVVFILFCQHLMLLSLCQLVNRRTRKKTKCILLNNEQANKVNSQRSFSCISVDFSGEDQQALFLSNSIHSCAAVKLGSEETEEKSIHASIRPLIFSLLPSFSPNLHHPFSPLLFVLP